MEDAKSASESILSKTKPGKVLVGPKRVRRCMQDDGDGCPREAASVSSASTAVSPSLQDRFRSARVRCASAESLEDLCDAVLALRSLVLDAGSGSEVWVDAGACLATLVLQNPGLGTLLEPGDEATSLLIQRGFAYRLSKASLTHAHTLPSSTPPADVARAWDDALPTPLLERLGAAFQPGSPFWSSHGYSDGSRGRPPSPYFSYVVHLPSATETARPTGVLRTVISMARQLLEPTFPQVKDCTAAEWWAHCRVHSSGHQLHFDSDDEGRGGVRNPAASIVINLSEGPIGGETLVTTQSSQQTTLATTGWLCANKRNRLLAFKGTLLHGVVPGPGVPPPSTSAHGTTDMGRRHGTTDMGRRRVTFMVAFWPSIRIQDDPGHGAARPFSRVERERWAVPLVEDVAGLGLVSPEPGPKVSPVEDCFFEVPVWEDVDEAANHAKLCALKDMARKRRLPPYDSFFQFYT